MRETDLREYYKAKDCNKVLITPPETLAKEASSEPNKVPHEFRTDARSSVERTKGK
jgi:hypothetical protein